MYQDLNKQGGKTAVNEVEAKLFSAKMNCEIPGWDYFGSFKSITSFGNSNYCENMNILFCYGYDLISFYGAVNSFISEMRFGVKGENGLNVLTTSHIEDTDYGSTSMLNKQYLFGYTMREHIHSHPRNTPKPSGFGEYEGKYDMEFARNIQGIRPNVLLKIYLPKSKSYINYSKDSTINDF